MTHPTGAETRYAYEKYTGNMGDYGSGEQFRIIERKEWADLNGTYTDINKKTLSYYGNYTGYPSYNYPNNLPDTYTYSCSETNADGLETYRIFNNKHKLSLEGLLDNHTLLEKAEYTYNTTTRQLIKNKYSQFNPDENIMVTYENYAYDTGGFDDVTGYWSTKASRDANGTPLNDDHKTSYSYDADYRILLQKEYKRDNNTVIRTVNALDATGKAVGGSCIYQIDGMGPAELKEKTEFIYDSRGNVTEERRYRKEGTTEWSKYVSTLYSYDDNVPARNGLLDGLYVTKTTVTGVADAHGNLISPSAGDVPGEISEHFEYDIMGNLTGHTDGAGYETFRTVRLGVP